MTICGWSVKDAAVTVAGPGTSLSIPESLNVNRNR